MSKKVLLIDDATGEYLPVANGTDGYVLTYDGDTSTPVWAAGGGGGGSNAADIMVNTTGVYGNSDVVLRLIAARAMSVTSTGSYFKCLTASSATKLVTVAQSGSASTSFDVTFSVAGGTTGSVPTGTTIALVVGDELTVTMPATADLTLAGVYFTLACTVTGA